MRSTVPEEARCGMFNGDSHEGITQSRKRATCVDPHTGTMIEYASTFISTLSGEDQGLLSSIVRGSDKLVHLCLNQTLLTNVSWGFRALQFCRLRCKILM